MSNQTQNSRSWLEINLSALRSNFLCIQQTVAPATIMPILKANAYGLGLVQIAKELASLGADRIGLADLSEARQLFGQVSCPLQIMGSLFPNEIPEALDLGLVCPVGDLNLAQLLSKEARQRGVRVKVHIKIDTGMGRLGIPHFIAVETIKAIQELPNLNIEGVYTHFANANNPSHPKTREQISIFKQILENTGLNQATRIHLANSDAINNFPEAYGNMVRTGINLYGVFDLLGHRAYQLHPTLSLKSRILAVRELPAGYTIGYSCTHTLFHKTRIGTLPIGYADGIPLSASNSGRVLVHGKECPIIGRISMDYLTVDLSSCPQAEVGDEVVLFGESEGCKITVEDWARIKQSHPYDIICSLGPRVQRVYV